MKRIEIVSSVLLATLAMACSGSGGGKGNGQPGAPVELIVPAYKTAGAFESRGEDPVTVADALRCRGNVNALDPNLRAGQRMVLEDIWSDENSQISGQAKHRLSIDRVDHAKGELVQTRRFKFDGQEVWTKTKCVYARDSGRCEIVDVSANLRSRMNRAGSGKVSRMKSCRISDDRIRKETVHRETGTYRFVDGRVVPAVRVTTEVTGEVVCGSDRETKMGPGIRQEIRILSFNVPSLDMSCGAAANVVSYEVVKDESGKALSFKKFELFELR